jgi:hypothetical protein
MPSDITIRLSRTERGDLLAYVPLRSGGDYPVSISPGERGMKQLLRLLDAHQALGPSFPGCASAPTQTMIEDLSDPRWSVIAQAMKAAPDYSPPVRRLKPKARELAEASPLFCSTASSADEAGL